MTRYVSSCYGDRGTIYDDVRHAFDGVERHIREECRFGTIVARPRWVWTSNENWVGWSAVGDSRWRQQRLKHAILVMEEE